MRRVDDFKSVLAGWKKQELPEVIPRDVKIPLDETLVITLAGVRRSGKTYTMFHLIKLLLEQSLTKENILYVNFEHEKLRNLDAGNLGEMLTVFYEFFEPGERPIYLFLDEVYWVRDWEKWVRRVHDSREFRIYLSGSSARLLSREISTTLRGRTITYNIFPFSFKEFLATKNMELSTKELELLPHLEVRGRVLRFLNEYMIFGGFPEVVLREDEKTRIKILRSYYDAIFYKDMIERFSIDNPQLLDSFLRYMVSNFSKYVSISKTYNYLKGLGLKCSKNTLLNMLKFAGEVFFLFPVEIFSYSIKDRKQYSRKIYCIDNGLIRAVFPEAEEQRGRLMENLVFLELLRRSELMEDFQIYYWKDHTGSEVDFVLKQGLRVRKLLQACYNMEGASTREIKSLIKASEELKCEDLAVVTWDYEGEEEFKGKRIKFIPLWKWMLSS